MNILNWPGWHILNLVESSRSYQITAEPHTAPTGCVYCGSVLLYRHAQKQQLFLDIPLHGKQTGIMVHRRSYRCRDCQRCFWESLAEMHPDHQMTRRLVTYIERETRTRTFVSISQETGLDEKTIRIIFRKATPCAPLVVTSAPLTQLGIDEIHMGNVYGVLSDLEHKCVVDLLPNRSKKSIIRALAQLPDRGKITLVSIDMWKPYADAVRLVLPQATIVIDRFHVVRMANQALETVRKSIRASLTPELRKGLMHDRFILLRRKADLNESQQLILAVWTTNLPQLGLAHDLKEAFFDLWKASTREEAMRLYQQWQARIPADLQPAFQPLLTAMENWRQEIFNYFDHSITNSYTEALNGLLRQVSRQGRGYSYQTIRAKLMLTQGFQAHRRPPYRKQIRGSPPAPEETWKQVRLIVAKHAGYWYRIVASSPDGVSFSSLHLTF